MKIIYYFIYRPTFIKRPISHKRDSVFYRICFLPLLKSLVRFRKTIVTFCFIKSPAFAWLKEATLNGSPEVLEHCPIYFERSLFQETCRIRNIGLRHVTTDTYLINFHAVKKMSIFKPSICMCSQHIYMPGHERLKMVFFQQK